MGQIKNIKLHIVTDIKMNSLNMLVLVLQLALHCWCKAEFKCVTCGSVVKLFNQRTGARLHSHDVKYGSGSGQQSVTGSGSPNDHNSYWIVRGKHQKRCTRGQVVKCGDTIRLQHLATKRNLHSHFFQSPITHNQEVSAFGENGDGDTGDNWVVKCTGNTAKCTGKTRSVSNTLTPATTSIFPTRSLDVRLPDSMKCVQNITKNLIICGLLKKECT